MTSSQDENNDPQGFHYLISSKGPVVIVTFVGELKNNCTPVLEACQAEVLAYDSAKYFILYLRDVPNISGDAITGFTQFQKMIRAKGQLRLSSVNPILREKLTKMGVVRNSEIVENLRVALKGILENHD